MENTIRVRVKGNEKLCCIVNPHAYCFSCGEKWIVNINPNEMIHVPVVVCIECLEEHKKHNHWQTIK